MLIKYCHANQNNPTHTAKFSNTPPHKKELSLKAKCPLTFNPKNCIHKHYVSQRKSTHTQKNSLSLPVRCTKKPLAHKNAHKTKLTFKPVTHTTKPISLTKNISHNSINHSHQKLAPHQKTPTPTNKHLSLSLSHQNSHDKKLHPYQKMQLSYAPENPWIRPRQLAFKKFLMHQKILTLAKKKKKRPRREKKGPVLFCLSNWVNLGFFWWKRELSLMGVFLGGASERFCRIFHCIIFLVGYATCYLFTSISQLFSISTFHIYYLVVSGR